MLHEELYQYNKEIEENSKSCGFKAANLMFLKDRMPTIQNKVELAGLKVKVEVPRFVIHKHQMIAEHLDQYGKNWRDLHSAFVDSYNNQLDHNTLEPETVENLRKLQSYIIETFIKYPFSDEALNDFLKDISLVMVRSTGINEDKVDMANPGGNLSLVAEAKDVSTSIGMVPASIVSEKSLLQRLKAGDRSITEVPIMPVLIQTLVGEGLDQTRGTNKVVSGVIYTNDGAMRIQSAPGHGEYVVNSKGPTDNYYISREAVIYSEIRPKGNRLVPKRDTSNNAISLNWESNPISDEYSSSLSPEALQAIQIAAKEIEAVYKMRMDIEFVYDVDNNTLNIVQARPIPPGNRNTLEPSALSSRYLANPAQTLQIIESLHIITPEINTAKVITSPSQVIICKDIKDALDEFLSPNNAGRDFRAIIVENYAPDTSHEAGQFNLNALPVMQVADIKTVEQILQEAEPLLIVDPQRRKIYQMDPILRNNRSDASKVEDDLYDKGILEKGIFASSLSAYVSSREYDFSEANRVMMNEPIEKALTITKNNHEKLGDLINRGEAGDSGAMQWLLSIGYEVISYEPKEPDQGEIDKVAAFTPTQLLKYNFLKLETPKIGEDNDACKAALAENLRQVANLCKAGFVSNTVFKQCVIAGTELAILLSKMEDDSFLGLDKKEQDSVLLEYFNINRKFEGIFLGTATRNVLVQSVMTDLFDKKQRMIVGEIARNANVDLNSFSEDQKEILYEVAKLGCSKKGSVFNYNWINFCVETCMKQENADYLAMMVSNLLRVNIHEGWLNQFFEKAYKVHQGDAGRVLHALKSDFEGLDIKSLRGAQRILSEMDGQVPKFADKACFDEAYNDFQINIDQIQELLFYHQELTHFQKHILIQNMKQFVDLMDRTLKSLDYSRDYQESEPDNELRANRFRKMIISFRDSLYPWLDNAFPLEKDQLLLFKKALDDAIDKSKEYDKNKILPTTDFKVNLTLIKDGQGKNSFSGRSSYDLNNCKSLEDCFSCIHQNFIWAIDQIESQQNLILGREFYPPLFAEFEESLMSELKGKGIPVSNPENHLNDKIPHIYYRIPLSVHNAVVTVFKHPNKDEYFMKYITGSPYSEEFWRWGIINAKFKFDLLASGIAQLQRPPAFDHVQNYSYEASFCVPISSDTIPLLLKIIQEAIANTYQEHYGKHLPVDEERFLKIEKMNYEFLKNNYDVILELINNSIYGDKQKYFSNHISKRIKILHTLQEQIQADNIFSVEEKSEEELLRNARFTMIKSLLNRSAHEDISAFISELYSNSEIDDIFCTVLTGYNKIDFMEKYFSGADKYQKISVIKGLLNNDHYLKVLTIQNEEIVQSVVKSEHESRAEGNKKEVLFESKKNKKKKASESEDNKIIKKRKFKK